MRAVLKHDKERGLYQGRNLEVICPSVEVIGVPLDAEQVMRHLEAAIRTAYKSEDKIVPGSAEKIISHILSLKHESTLEHCSVSFRVVTNRGVTHEIVRHRVGHSYTQESTRYVNYGKRPPQVILPWHLCTRSDDQKDFWYNAQADAIDNYLEALKFGWAPQDARGLLPNDLKTEIVWSMNLRAARHMDGLRTPKSAHPDMQVTAREIHRILYESLPLLFQDIQNQIDTAAWIEQLAKD
jgi:thymidylate synthase (FAD)